MVQVRDLTELTVRDLWAEVKEGDEAWWGDLKIETVRVVKRLLEASMEEELLEQLRAGRYRRSGLRRGYRNGYRQRELLTELGLVEHLRVPRDREGQFQPTVLPRYQRRQQGVNRLVREMFLCGVSTRKVQEVVEPLLGASLSAQSVSRITRSLDAEVRRFQERPLEDRYQYLLLDGITLKVKGAAGVKKRLVLCAYSITPQGQREMISFRQASSESEVQWEAFLGDLYDRGLGGKALRLVTTDGCKGLHRALDTVYPYIPRQRCWAHKLRNVAAKLPRKHQEACLQQAKGIYQAQTRRGAVTCFWEWAARWRSVAPKAVACLEEDLDELLPFLACPQTHWKKVRTTNAIERAFREVRRRTKPMSCFQNSASVDRIIYGVISHLNRSWEAKPLSEFTHNT
ncbi:MAG: IS256 family transposase [Dehalococcoidia bacterium]